MKGYATLKWALLQAGEKAGLPFYTEEGNFTPEFKEFWEIFEEDIRQFKREQTECRMRWLPTIVSLTVLIIALCKLV